MTDDVPRWMPVPTGPGEWLRLAGGRVGLPEMVFADRDLGGALVRWVDEPGWVPVAPEDGVWWFPREGGGR